MHFGEITNGIKLNFKAKFNDIALLITFRNKEIQHENFDWMHSLDYTWNLD